MDSDLGGTPRLSITCVIHSLDGGGAERVMAGLASRLALRGHGVHLVTLRDESSDRHAVSDRVERLSVGLNPSATGFNPIARIRRRHRLIRETVIRTKPDVILSFCDRMNIDVLLSLGKTELPIVISERSDPSEQSLGMLWNRVRRFAYGRASDVIALNEKSARYLRAFSGPVHVIPSAVEVPDLFSDRSLASDAKLIVGAGRLVPEKRFDRLISAFAEATKDDRTWRLVIFGDGPLRPKLIEHCRREGVADRVEMAGWVRDLKQQMTHATLFCLSSQYEGFPSVLLEAMSMGVPTISVDCESGPREIIDDERNGLLVPPSAEDLARGLRRLIEDRELRERLGMHGRQIVDRYGWDSMVQQYEQVLGNAASGRR